MHWKVDDAQCPFYMPGLALAGFSGSINSSRRVNGNDRPGDLDTLPDDVAQGATSDPDSPLYMPNVDVRRHVVRLHAETCEEDREGYREDCRFVFRVFDATRGFRLCEEVDVCVFRRRMPTWEKRQ